MNTSPPKKNELFPLQIVWFALLMSQGIYAFVLYQQVGIKESFRWFSQEPVHMPLYLMALIVGVFSLFLPQRLLNQALAKQNSEMSLKVLMVPFILRLALSEAVCLFGFIVGLQSQIFQFILPFFILSIFLFLKTTPSSQNISKWLHSRKF